MNRYTLKMLLRSIKASFGRFMAIAAIVALGVGFYAGLMSSKPAMMNTVNEYMRTQRMYDFRCLSTLGFLENDVAAMNALDGVEYAEGSYFIDAMVQTGTSADAYQLVAITENVSVPYLTAGRLPESSGECLLDSNLFTEEDIGTVITVTEDSGDTVLDMLEHKSFVVTGIAKSPRYISKNRGTTALASGSVAGFILLTKDAFGDTPYHEILISCGIDAELYSDEYNETRDEIAPTIEKKLNSLGKTRLGVLERTADHEIYTAKTELSDGQREFFDGIMDANTELPDARHEIEDGEKQIADGRAELEKNQAEIDDGLKQIEDGARQIEENRQLIFDTKQEVILQRAAVTEEAARINSDISAVNSQITELELKRSEYVSAYATDASVAAAEIAAADAAIAELDPDTLSGKLAIAALNAAKASAQTRLDTAQAQLEAANAEFESIYGEELSPLYSRLEELTAEKTENETALATVELTIAQLEAGLQEIAEAEEELNENRNALYDGQIRLTYAQQNLDISEEELEDGREEYLEGAEDALEELSDGQTKLLYGELQLKIADDEREDSLALDLYTLDRSSNAGLVTFESDVQIIEAAARAFPLFLVLIAALVCGTTMTRMVSEERTVIGSLKAMGVSKYGIMRKYLIYSGSASALGCAGGFALGTTVIPYIVWYAYGILYSYSALLPYFSGKMLILCACVSVLGSIAVTAYTCSAVLREKPAELLRPRAPKTGRRILLERAGFIWRRLSFVAKAAMRNAFRHRARVFMILLGIGGCTALLIAGFGVKDSLAHVLDYQYDEIFLYDVEVNYDPEEITPAELLSAAGNRADGAAFVYSVSADASETGGDITKSISLIASDKNELEDIIDLHLADEEIPWPVNGQTVICTSLADDLGIKAGDSITLATDDGDTLTLTVSAECDNYLGRYVFINSSELQRDKNLALIRSDDPDIAQKLAASLRTLDGVDYVSLTQTSRDTMEASMASLDAVIALVVVCAAGLAFITLFNLTNINIMERVRDIATVKVLGFTGKETSAFILKENLILSVLGAAVGVPLGKLLHRVIVNMIKVEYMTYDVRIKPLSYILSVVITVVFALLANRMMCPKLKKVNMAESLKSVE